jgi:hypothetical protein
MSSECAKYAGYIRDLAYLLRERIVEAQGERSKGGDAFAEGRELGLREALSWMQHQADSFELPKEDLCLAGFDALTDPVDIPPPISESK